MKLKNVLLETSNEELAEHRQWRTESMRKKFNIPNNTSWINVYHGTKLSNVKSIERSGFKTGTWFATDEKTSDIYAKMAGGKPYVMQCRVYIGSLLPSGDYMVSQEPLISTSVGYVPKDLVKNVYDIK